MRYKKTLLIFFIILTFCVLGYPAYLLCGKTFSNLCLQYSSSEESTISHVDNIDSTSQNSPYDLAFAVLGDIHDNESDFQDSVDDIKSTDIKLDALILNGDTVDQGIASQYEEMKNAIQKNINNLPSTIIKNIGNHEFYDYDHGNKSKEDVDEKIQKYLDFAQEKNVYHDKWINQYHFISLGSEDGNSPTCSSTSAFISNTQISWLEEKLSENYEKGRPIFVFLHQPLILNWGWGDIPGTNVSSNLNNIFSKYPEVILFNSHTHKHLTEECINTNNGYTIGQTGAVSYTLFNNSDNTLSRDHSYTNGLLITIKDNIVNIRGRDFKNHEWIFSKDIDFK